MATELKFKITEAANSKKISFYETTGSYNASTNLTGWGAPNEATTDATTATVQFKSPAGVTYEAVSVFASGYPNTDGTFSVDIPATSVGTLTEFVDGIWEITYTVVTSTTTYTTTNSVFLYKKAQSAVCSLIACLNINACTCDNEKLDAVLQMNAYLSLLEYQVGCANTTAANDTLTTLLKLVECTTC